MRDARRRARRVPARFTHLFVDEFQDTDPLQAEILLLLAADDPARARLDARVGRCPASCSSSAIRSSRSTGSGAPTSESTRHVCDLLEARGASARSPDDQLPRAPAIQRVVNAAFAPLMTGDRATRCRRSYVAAGAASRATSPSQPAVVALPVPEPYGKRSVAGDAIEKSLPDAVGAFVDWLVNDSGWTVTERTTRDELPMAVPIEPRHVCLLFRRFLQLRRAT